MSASPESTNNGPAFQAIIPGLCEPLNFTNTSAYSQIFEEETTILELFPTQDCWIQIILSSDSSTVAQAGSSGAVSYNKFIPGGITAFLGVPKTRGVQYKIAVVRATASNGILYITQGRS
jgi:hypothetical protein